MVAPEVGFLMAELWPNCGRPVKYMRSRGGVPPNGDFQARALCPRARYTDLKVWAHTLLLQHVLEGPQRAGPNAGWMGPNTEVLLVPTGGPISLQRLFVTAGVYVPLS